MTVMPKPSSEGTLPACLPQHLLRPNLRRREASEYLELAWGLTVAPTTLAKLASIGGGPCFYRGMGRPIYPREELDKFAIARRGRLLRSTSDTGEA